MKSVLATAYTVFFALCAGFFLHRATSWTPLAPAEGLDGPATLAAAAVGAWSDIWIAFLAAILILGAGTARAHRWLAWSLVVSVALVTAGHQAYVEFFRIQIVPFHLRYLTDLAFLRANGRAVLTWSALANLVGTIAAGGLMLRLDAFRVLSRRQAIVGFLALGALALIGHNRNIVLRMRWFVPENLQLNVFERFYVTATTSRMPKPLSTAQIEFLRRELGAPNQASTPDSLIERPPPTEADIDAIGQALHQAFAEARAAGRKPMALAVLLESLRPSETGYFAPDKPSLTPNLDAIARRAIVFTNAHGTGSVTRGAQEAVFCGYPAGRDTSAMRGRMTFTPTCLPELISKRGDSATVWYHGGEGRFDSQMSFWRSQHVADFLSVRDFPDTAPQTGWGVGDIAFLAAAGDRLAKLHATTHKRDLLGMLLTVTNHIPWRLPDDAPEEVRRIAATAAHPSWATTAYADAAVGRFVERLKESGLWQDALLVLASDHGTSTPAYADLYGADPTAERRRESHINLIVTGGIAERVAASRGGHVVRTELVSQVDIGGFFAYLFDAHDARLLSESLFARTRRTPVLSDLEGGLFSPATGAYFSKRDIVEADADARSGQEKLSLLYFRAFLLYLAQHKPT